MLLAAPMFGRRGAGAGARAAPGMRLVTQVSLHVYGRMMSTVTSLVSGVAAWRRCRRISIEKGSAQSCMIQRRRNTAAFLIG